MVTVEADVEAGSRANCKRKRDQFAWDYRDETSGGGGDEGASEGEVVLSADERKRARLGYGATDPSGLSQWFVPIKYSCIMIRAHLAGIDANTSCVLNWSRIK